MAEDHEWLHYTTRFRTYPLKTIASTERAQMVICIPAYAEPDLTSVLESLSECDLPPCEVEVVLLFNTSDRMTDAEKVIHDQSWWDSVDWIGGHERIGLRFLPVRVDDMPDPQGGVGWARKLAMDEGARRSAHESILVGLDADCRVASNYLRSVYDFFEQYPNLDAASIYFEHPLDLPDKAEREKIIQYELHLRYLVQAMRWAGHPHAFHTVGSSMAVRRKAYLRQGGMNTRMAGEDFYFLQKFIEIGRLQDLTTTVVYPSARVSGRVPFGTGRAMGQMEQRGWEWVTTDPAVFEWISPLFVAVDTLRDWAGIQESSPYVALQSALKLDQRLVNHLGKLLLWEICLDIRAQTTTAAAFRKRFFRYFNGFRMIRYMHDMRDQHVPDIPVREAALKLCRWLGIPVSDEATSAEELLNIFRRLDRQPSSVRSMEV